MTLEQKITELLFWIKSLGLTPVKPKRHDRFLNPYTRRTLYYHPRRAQQTQHLLWIPNEQGLRPYFPTLRMEKICGMTAAVFGPWIGAGTGESEALLSLLHQIRPYSIH